MIRESKISKLTVVFSLAYDDNINLKVKIIATIIDFHRYNI